MILKIGEYHIFFKIRHVLFIWGLPCTAVFYVFSSRF